MTYIRSAEGSAILRTAGWLLTVLSVSCSRPSSMPPAAESSVKHDAGQVSSALGVKLQAGSPSPDAGVALAAVNEERTISFDWKPSGASAAEYSMDDPRDQHEVWLFQGLERGKSYPVVIAMHGQPRRGQAPRNYRFVRVVSDVARELIGSKATPLFVLVTPVFRFRGQNWPHFDLVAFMARAALLLREQGIAVSNTYVFGHSGAAGCGGQGLDRVAALSPAAVGFFDTCVGAGFQQAARELAAHRVPTFIAHSVETAGFHPRQLVEYDATFDFGQVYSAIGLRQTRCPSNLPDAPLRKLDYRCASNDSGSTLALVLDTGVGEQAHEALVPVAMRYFIKWYVNQQPVGR